LKSKFIITLFSGLVLLSCHKKQDKPESSFQQVYEMSEMALLMEDMYAELEEMRPEIIDEKTIGEFPEKFNKIHTAEMTSSFERTAEFENFAGLLLQNQKALYQSQADSARIGLYNSVVKTCISCHKSDAGCIGPVSRIGKLLIDRK